VIRGILFDLDGTLLDSAPDLVATLNHLRDGLGLEALPETRMRAYASHGAAGLIGAGMPPCDDPTMAARKRDFIEHYARHSYVRSRPFSGIGKLLAELADSGIPWGIVTNKIESLCVPILEQVGWLGSLSALVCGDSVQVSKPDPAGVLLACETMGVSPADALMVGDDPRDIEAGWRAGSQTVFVNYGYSGFDDSGPGANVSLRVESPGEILGLLKNRVRER
jgi:phosphoglycolate phosphatase